MKNNEVTGEVDGIKYAIVESIVDRMKKEHNVDAIEEIRQALKQYKEIERKKNAS